MGNNEIGCVLTYEIIRKPGAYGQTVGADGTGLFAEIYKGDPEAAAEAARGRIKMMLGFGWKLGPVHLVQNGECYGWGGSPVRFIEGKTNAPE